MLRKIDYNKMFYVDDSAIHGKGLFARTKLKKGKCLGTYDGPKTKNNAMHVLWVEEEEGKWIGRDGKNILRYLNHSNKPCAEFDGFDLYVMRDIKKDEEVTFDYGEDPAG
jgi:SET domain-containing protein